MNFLTKLITFAERGGADDLYLVVVNGLVNYPIFSFLNSFDTTVGPVTDPFAGQLVCLDRVGTMIRLPITDKMSLARRLFKAACIVEILLDGHTVVGLDNPIYSPGLPSASFPSPTAWSNMFLKAVSANRLSYYFLREEVLDVCQHYENLSVQYGGVANIPQRTDARFKKFATQYADNKMMTKILSEVRGGSYPYPTPSGYRVIQLGSGDFISVSVDRSYKVNYCRNESVGDDSDSVRQNYNFNQVVQTQQYLEIIDLPPSEI